MHLERIGILQFMQTAAGTAVAEVFPLVGAHLIQSLRFPIRLHREPRPIRPGIIAAPYTLMNHAMRAAVLDFATLSSRDIDTTPLDRAAPGIVYYDVTPPDQLAERLTGLEVVVINKVRLDAATIAACPELKLISLAATGTDNVDLAAAREAGVGVTNIRAYCTAAVVQHVFALILGLTQHLKPYEAELKAGAWRDSPQFCMLGHPIRELAGKRFGIVGHGELGSAAAVAARAFGMEVLSRAGRARMTRGRIVCHSPNCLRHRTLSASIVRSTAPLKI